MSEPRTIKRPRFVILGFSPHLDTGTLAGPVAHRHRLTGRETGGHRITRRKRTVAIGLVALMAACMEFMTSGVATAGSPPPLTGSVSCTSADFGLAFKASLLPSPKRLRQSWVKFNQTMVGCAGSYTGGNGGTGAISTAVIKAKTKLPDGNNCLDALRSSPTSWGSGSGNVTFLDGAHKVVGKARFTLSLATSIQPRLTWPYGVLVIQGQLQMTRSFSGTASITLIFGLLRPNEMANICTEFPGQGVAGMGTTGTATF